jgi:uncharacterized protein with FMN-binding domain
VSRRFGWARALAGFAAFAAVAAAPVVIKGATADEETPVLAVGERGAGGAGGRAAGSDVGTVAAGGSGASGAATAATARGGTARTPATDGGESAGGGAPEKSPGGSGQAPTRGRKPGQAPAKQPPAGGGSATGTITGDSIDTQYGPMQFAINVRDGRVVSIQDLKLPGDTRSLEINTPAMPRLHAQTVRTQAAHVDTISGATITCQAYSISIQSALDRL